MKFTSRGRIAHGNKLAAFLLGGSLLLALAGLAVSARSALAGQSRATEQTKDARPALKPFLGTWKGSFGGKVFAILVVKQDDRGDIAGTLNNFDIGRDKSGNLDDDTHIDVGDGPILNVHLRSDALYFVAIQKDQYSPSTEWKFVPTNASEGELTQMLDGQPYSPNGSVPKPILMLRDRPKP
jgi:hypothetical protein